MSEFVPVGLRFAETVCPNAALCTNPLSEMNNLRTSPVWGAVQTSRGSCAATSAAGSHGASGEVVPDTPNRADAYADPVRSTGPVLWLCALALGAALGVTGAGGVVGGQVIPIGSAPWAVFLRDTFGSGDQEMCSGSIIDATHVLTAAHCLYNSSGLFVKPGQIVVEAGISNFLQPTATDARQERRVRSFRIFPGYVWTADETQATVATDLAVIELARPLVLGGPDVQAIPLLDAGAAHPSGNGYILAGFGREQASSAADGALERMSVEVAPASNTCTQAHVLCATAATSSPCYGDSGAGLVALNPNPTLVGVTVEGTCVPGTWSFYNDLGSAIERRFIESPTLSAPPPRVRASRWVPAGWLGYSGFSQSGFSFPLSYALPRTWSAGANAAGGANIYNAGLRGQSSVSIYPGEPSEDSFFGRVRAEAVATYRARDPKADIRWGVVQLPGGTALEIIVQAVFRVGAHTYFLRVENFNLFHDGVGYDVTFQGPTSENGVLIPLFARAAATIHFLASS